ncbi:MAG: methionine--tRNA ligase [Candidatus Staskawiczbacteria bacterium]|nr:methionine--tRNA ligase [Candidatus Staskawiczbacteria bacterium]
MFNKKKKFYITTTLPYVNAEPHIGFAMEIIQADVIARFKRQQGFEVFFNFGTDEHGIKIYRKAQEAGIDPKTYCDIYAPKFNDLKAALNVTYDNFIRTTDEHHVKSAQEFWKLCKKKGDIYKKNYKVKYCVGCELEKMDSELENEKCPIHPNLQIELIEEENYFFKYSNYQEKLLKLYEKNPKFVIPTTKLNEIIEFTKRGLQDFSISRLKEKMPWGVDVPGDDKHVMYVWTDALVSYISALGWPENKKQFNNFWPGMQVAGKDNLRQQSSMWQAMLMSCGLPNSSQIFIHGFITVGGQKISKSLGNVINPFELVKKYGVDAVRYYLLREITPTEDGDFTYEKFEQRYNADLAGGAGNLVARTITLAQKLEIQNYKSQINPKFKIQIEETGKKCKQALEEYKFNEALKSIWELISFCDRYINEQKPWEAKENASEVISDILFALDNMADLLLPFLPDTSEKIKKAVQTKQSQILFPRITQPLDLK